VGQAGGVVVDRIEIKGVEVSRFVLGSNPFSGISHQSPEASRRMAHYYTTARLKEVLFEAERLGVNTIIARGDRHVTRLLLEYWDEGGRLQWVAQTCPELGPPEVVVRRAMEFGAKGCFVHGGYMDHLLAHGRLGEIPPVLERIKKAGMACGVAGHIPEVFRWAEENAEADFYMCSYYNPIARVESAGNVEIAAEQYLEKDRAAMTEMIRSLSRPAIHYKIMAAGRNEPREAFGYAARAMRENDAVCVGVYTEGKPGMVEEDVRLLEEGLAGARS